MRHSTRITSFLIAVLAITATSCYTQLQTAYDSYPASGYYSSDDDRVVSGNRSLEERSNEVVNEEDYTLGYDDGWSDAEGYYFKDYEAKRWYEEYGATLAHDPYVRHYTLNHHRYGRGFSPYHSYYYPHYPYYSHAYWSSRWTFSLGFHAGWGWNHWYPHYSYNPYYDYYAYPGYYPYYGGYWGWGYNRPYYGNTVVIYNGSRGTNRTYGPRGNGLTSRGSDTVRRTRSDASVRNTANRSDVRSNARSRNVSGSRSRGTVNRSSGTTRSRSSSTVRSRSGSSNSRGTVNRGSSNRSRSSGSVNRSRSSNNRSSGSVNRSRSSSSNRSNGTVNRSSRNSGSSSVRSRSSSRDNNRSLSSRSESTVSNRSNSTISRNPFSGTYIGNEYSSVSSAVQDDVTNQTFLSRRERALNMIRNQASVEPVVEPSVSARNVSSSRSSDRSRANIGSDEGVIISRGTSITTNRDNDHRRSTVNSRIRDYNQQRDRSRVENNRPQTRRERTLNSLRSQMLDHKADSPDKHYSRSSRSSGSSFFDNKIVRDVYKSVVNSSRSSSSNSSYGRSSSSGNRSSSVSRSRSNNSSRSTVRSSRSSSSSKSRGSSSRSRSSSSRDRN